MKIHEICRYNACRSASTLLHIDCRCPRCSGVVSLLAVGVASGWRYKSGRKMFDLGGGFKDFYVPIDFWGNFPI